METLLAIDPGRAKCGLAVVSGPDEMRCLERCVVETERLTLAVAEILRRYPTVTRFLIGNATHSGVLRRAIEEMFPHIPLETVNEYNTSARARGALCGGKILRPACGVCCRLECVPPKSPTMITPRFCWRKIIFQKKWIYKPQP